MNKRPWQLVSSHLRVHLIDTVQCKLSQWNHSCIVLESLPRTIFYDLLGVTEYLCGFKCVTLIVSFVNCYTSKMFENVMCSTWNAHTGLSFLLHPTFLMYIFAVMQQLKCWIIWLFLHVYICYNPFLLPLSCINYHLPKVRQDLFCRIC